MDQGVRWAIAHRVANSQTLPKWLNTHTTSTIPSSGHSSQIIMNILESLRFLVDKSQVRLIVISVLTRILVNGRSPFPVIHEWQVLLMLFL